MKSVLNLIGEQQFPDQIGKFIKIIHSIYDNRKKG